MAYCFLSLSPLLLYPYLPLSFTSMDFDLQSLEPVASCPQDEAFPDRGLSVLSELGSSEL